MNGNGHGPQQQSLAQPAPAQVTVQAVKDPAGKDRVLLTIDSVNGTFRFFVEPAQAELIGGGMGEAARTARTGLIIPSPQLPTDLTGGGER